MTVTQAIQWAHANRERLRDEAHRNHERKCQSYINKDRVTVEITIITFDGEARTI